MIYVTIEIHNYDFILKKKICYFKQSSLSKICFKLVVGEIVITLRQFAFLQTNILWGLGKYPLKIKNQIIYILTQFK